MAYVDIEYKKFSFEENPGLITWIQLYLIKFLKEEKLQEDWASTILEEWEMNSKIDIYKYIFDEDLLNTKEKEDWAKQFVQKAIDKIDQMNILEFSQYIEIEIDPQVDFERIKRILKKIGLMLNDKSPE